MGRFHVSRRSCIKNSFCINKQAIALYVTLKNRERRGESESRKRHDRDRALARRPPPKDEGLGLEAHPPALRRLLVVETRSAALLECLLLVASDPTPIPHVADNVTHERLPLVALRTHEELAEVLHLVFAVRERSRAPA
jgi:hypothetical protein